MSVSLRLSSVICIAILAFLATAEAVNTSRPQADSFAKKLAIIKQHAAESPKSSRRTTVTEGELNSWFVYRAPALLPVGVKDPRVTVVGNGKLVGLVTVDLDDVGKSKSGAWNVLGGRVPISLSGVLRTKDGRGQFDLQSADISGVPVPDSWYRKSFRTTPGTKTARTAFGWTTRSRCPRASSRSTSDRGRPSWCSECAMRCSSPRFSS
jgi:hypothetical protein